MVGGPIKLQPFLALRKSCTQWEKVATVCRQRLIGVWGVFLTFMVQINDLK